MNENNMEKTIKGLKYLHDVQQWALNESAENMSARRNITSDAIALINEMDNTIRALMGEFGDSCDVDGCGG